MRRLFHLLTLVALLFAPLAAPVAAMSAAPAATECGDMAMGDHDMPTSDHGVGEACCIAVPPAIDPLQNSLVVAAAAGHLAFNALTDSFRLGAGLHTEDPPPRIF